MPRFLGDRFLPESVVVRRRSVRRRVRNLRNPIRSFRESNIPGPDVVGSVENTVLGARNRIVTRDALVNSLRDMARSDEDEEEENEEEENMNRGRNSDTTITT